MVDSSSANVNRQLIPFSTCARRVAQETAIKSMYAKQMTWGGLANAMLDIPWSPSTYINNHRKSVNFISSRAIGFDFDNGLVSLDEMVDIIKDSNLTSHIGTTRSHQKAKGDAPALDRFRIVLLMDSETIDSELYSQQMKHFMKIWQTNNVAWFDIGCMDAARFFRPCIKIIHSQVGDPLGWIKKAEKPAISTKQIKKIGNITAIPNWVIKCIEDPSHMKTGRNHTAYICARALTELGFGIHEVYAYISSSYLATLGEKELLEACRSGCKKGQSS